MLRNGDLMTSRADVLSDASVGESVVDAQSFAIILIFIQETIEFMT